MSSPFELPKFQCSYSSTSSLEKANFQKQQSGLRIHWNNCLSSNKLKEHLISSLRCILYEKGLRALKDIAGIHCPCFKWFRNSTIERAWTCNGIELALWRKQILKKKFLAISSGVVYNEISSRFINFVVIIIECWIILVDSIKIFFFSLFFLPITVTKQADKWRTATNRCMWWADYCQESLWLRQNYQVSGVGACAFCPSDRAVLRSGNNKCHLVTE